VAHGAVAARLVMADDAVLLCPQRRDGALRSEVEVIGAQSDDLARELLERMTEEQQLARRVDMAFLPALRVPRVADLDALGILDDVVVAGAADDGATRELAHDEGQHVPRLLAGERL